MSRSTISTFQLFERFPDAESARLYFEGRLWPSGPRCPVCGLGERITTRKGGFYRCNQCKEDFTVRTGTIFERSHVPLHKWLYAMYLLVTARKGISSLQLSKQIGITQKSAWFVLHRLREACGDELTKLQGTVEIDETFVGGIEANKHKHKKLKAGRGSVGKTAVLGMRERKTGKLRAMPVENTDMATIHTAVIRNVEAMNDTQNAIVLANKVLEKPHIDPDGDICLLAREFLRACEIINVVATNPLPHGNGPICRAFLRRIQGDEEPFPTCSICGAYKPAGARCDH